MGFRTGDTVMIHSPIDMHTHLREPGGEAQETIGSGTRAGLAGGYQMLSDMPNNAAPYQTWTPERIDEKAAIIERDGLVHVGTYSGVDFSDPNFGAIPGLVRKALGTKFYMGFTTNNSAELTLDDVRDYADAWIAECRTQDVELPILLHARGDAGAETANYVAHRGHPVHWCHVSAAREAAWARVLSRTYPELFSAGVTPHHLTMTRRNADFQQGWNGARMMPPLGEEVDADALLDAYNAGDIQVLETDHAPHEESKKLAAEDDNPGGELGQDCTTCFGISGIEFVLPVMTALVRRRLTTMERLEDSLYAQPLRILRLQHLAGTVLNATTTLEMGPHVIGESEIMGASRNTPYVGWTAGARVVSMQRNHQVVYGDDGFDWVVPEPGNGRHVYQRMEGAV